MYYKMVSRSDAFASGVFCGVKRGRSSNVRTESCIFGCIASQAVQGRLGLGTRPSNPLEIIRELLLAVHRLHLADLHDRLGDDVDTGSTCQGLRGEAFWQTATLQREVGREGRTCYSMRVSRTERHGQWP